MTYCAKGLSKLMHYSPEEKFGPHVRRQSFNSKAEKLNPNSGNLAELQHMQFQPLKFIVPDLIVPGLTILAGKPKIGKSLCVLQMAYSVARGIPFLEPDKNCLSGDVLYLALEDNRRRLQNRLIKIAGSTPWPENFKYYLEMPRANDGGIEFLRNQIEQNDSLRLVVIDVFAQFRTPSTRRDSYGDDYAAVKAVHNLIQDRDLAIVIVHHCRKSENDDDLLDAISGTTGFVGAADNAFVLKHSWKLDGASSVLEGKGRDIEWTEMAINMEDGIWRYIGRPEECKGGLEGQILTVLQDMKPATVTPKEVAGVTGASNDSVKRTLQRMAGRGDVTKVGRGQYKAL